MNRNGGFDADPPERGKHGAFTLRVEVAGANAAAGGAKHFFGLDYVLLEKP